MHVLSTWDRNCFILKRMSRQVVEEKVQSQAVGKTGEENTLTRIMYCEPPVKDVFWLIFLFIKFALYFLRAARLSNNNSVHKFLLTLNALDFTFIHFWDCLLFLITQLKGSPVMFLVSVKSSSWVSFTSVSTILQVWTRGSFRVVISIYWCSYFGDWVFDAMHSASSMCLAACGADPLVFSELTYTVFFLASVNILYTNVFQIGWTLRGFKIL